MRTKGISRTFLTGLCRKVTNNDFQVFDYYDWVAQGGFKEMTRRKFRSEPYHRPQDIEAVQSLKQGAYYILYDKKIGKFTGRVRVFVGGQAQFQFKRPWHRACWHSPHVVALMKPAYEVEFEGYAREIDDEVRQLDKDIACMD